MLSYIFLAQTASAEAVLKRFDTFMSKVDTLVVGTKPIVNGVALGSGTLYVDRPSRVRITLKSDQLDQFLIMTEAQGLEVNRTSGFYSFHPTAGQFYMPSFVTTRGLSYVAPQGLITGRSADLMPRGAKLQVQMNTTASGKPADLVRGKVEGNGGNMEARAWIDKAGKLLRYEVSSVTVNGTIKSEQAIANYEVNSKIPPAIFSTKLPAGAVPYALNRGDYGLVEGEPLPNMQLKQAQNGGAANLRSLISGRNTLVVFADPDFPSNAAMFQSIQSIAKDIPKFKLVVVSSRRDAASSKRIGVSPVYFDATGSQSTKMLLPGYPAMYLVGTNGQVVQMFFGFDGKWEGLRQAIERIKKAG